MERKYFSGSFCQSCVHGNESRLVQYPAGNKLTAFHCFSIQAYRGLCALLTTVCMTLCLPSIVLIAIVTCFWPLGLSGGGGGGGAGGLQKFFFSALRALVWSKNKGGSRVSPDPSPGSATVFLQSRSFLATAWGLVAALLAECNKFHAWVTLEKFDQT